MILALSTEKVSDKDTLDTIHRPSYLEYKDISISSNDFCLDLDNDFKLYNNKALKFNATNKKIIILGFIVYNNIHDRLVFYYNFKFPIRVKKNHFPEFAPGELSIYIS